MKKMKNLLWMAALALTAATMTACSNDELQADEKPAQKDNVVTLVTTLSPKGGDTRALSDPGDGTITSTWAVGEELHVDYKKSDDSGLAAKATVTSIDGSGNATITVDLVDPKDGGEIDFNYPYSDAMFDLIEDNQIGTLDDISKNWDYCYGSGTLSVSGGTATLSGTVTMDRLTCIWKFSFTDGSTDITSDITSLNIKVYISDLYQWNYTIIPSSLSTIYLACYPNDKSGPATVTITATTPSGTYKKTASGITLYAGKMYTSTGLALSLVP